MVSFRKTPKEPVPTGASWPSMMFSLTPSSPSLSPKQAASSRMSTVSSKEHLINGPVSCLLMPCLVMAIRWPR